MKARRVELYVAEDHDLQVRLEDVGEKRLVHPRAPDRAAAIADDGVEDLESAPPRHRNIGALDLAEHRGLVAGAQRRDRLHVTAIFVTKGKPVEEIFDADEAGALEIRGLARTNALQ